MALDSIGAAGANATSRASGDTLHPSGAHSLTTREPSFVERNRRELELSDIEFEVFQGAGVHNYAALFDMLRTFPSIAELGVDVPRLSHSAARRLPESIRAGLAADSPRRAARPAHAGGTLAPQGARGRPGQPVARAAPAAVAMRAATPSAMVATSGRAGPPLKAIDLRMHNWPVRDQGDRGTCAAFSAIACREHLARSHGRHGVVLSAQYLYWATKTRVDPAPHAESTFLKYVCDALSQFGACDDGHWPYDGTVMANNVTHESPPALPSTHARTDALTWRHAGTAAAPTPPGSAAAAVLAILRSGRPVAASLPMFKDPSGAYPTNWETAFAYDFGSVMDPPVSAISALGHAVCITGFVPDPSEAQGGYFIVRNSWGPGWGAQPTTAGFLSPEVGYGQISASYVENYLWELLAL